MSASAGQRQGLLVSGRFAELEDALVERVRELPADDPLAPLTIVVGSSALCTHVLDLLVRRLGAIANVRVVTFARAAADEVAKGGGPVRQASALVRERLVRRLVADRQLRRELLYFGPVSNQPHFAQALLATFDDLRQANVPPQAPLPASPQAKADDLQALYAAYCAALTRLDLSDEAAVFAGAAACSCSARGASGMQAACPRPAVILYGLYDVNQVQAEYVRALLDGGADLFVPRPRAADDRCAPILAVARPHGLAERSPETPAASCDAERIAASVWAARASGSRAALGGDGSFAVVSVPDDRSEVREAVREVLAVLAGGDAESWECALVVPHAADVERFAAGLRRAGLPAACRLPDRSAASRLLLRLLDCLVPPAGKPFSRRAVLDLLCVSAPSVTGDAQRFPGSWLWADEARQAGIVSGLEQWKERTRRHRTSLAFRLAASGEQGAGAEDDPERRQELALRLEAARGLEAAVAALAQAFANMPPESSWAGWAEWLSGALERTFAPEVAAGAVDAVNRLRALDLIGEEVSAAEAAAVLRRSLDGGRVPQGRPGRDGVAVLTPLELRGLRFHTVVFAGFAEGGFPVRGRPDSVLGDGERRRLREALDVRVPLAEDRDAEALLLFALAAESARERLVLLSPRTDAASGRLRLPSRLLLRLASTVAGHAVGLDEFLSGEPLRAVWRRSEGLPGQDRASLAADDGPPVPPAAVWSDIGERDVATLLALGAAGAEPASSYLQEVLERPGAARRRLAAWRAWQDPVAGRWDGLLSPAALGVLSPGFLACELHPTRLEAFIRCPFPFLLRDVLGLMAPEEPDEGLEMDPLEFGSLAHAILEQAFAEVIAGGLDRDGALLAVEKAHAACCADAEARGVTGDDLAWSARKDALLEDLLETVRRDPVFREGRPVLVEWRFGERHGRPVTLELGGGRTVRFAGRIDRVDRTPSGIRIVDYKTGKGETEEKCIKAGLSVQLPVYRLAVAQSDVLGNGEEESEIDCLYQMVTRRGSFAKKPLELPVAASALALGALVGEVLRLVGEGVFVRSTGGRCDSCEVRYACGASGWTHGRKRRDERLASLVALQKGDIDVHGLSQAGEQ